MKTKNDKETAIRTFQQVAAYLQLDCENLSTTLRERKVTGVSVKNAPEEMLFSERDVDCIADFYAIQNAQMFGPWATIFSGWSADEREQLSKELTDAPLPF